MRWTGSRDAEAQHKAAVKAKGGEAKHAKKRRKKRKGDVDGVNWVARQYGQRNRLLRELGIGPTYADYLASDLWKGIRQRVLGRDEYRCQICAEKASAVHHQRYRKGNLLGLSLSHMFAICEKCHKAIEFDKDGKKQSPRSAACAAFDLAKRNGKGLLKERVKRPKLSKDEKKAIRIEKARQRQEANLRRKNRAKMLEIQRQEKAKAPKPVEIVPPVAPPASNLPPTAWTKPAIAGPALRLNLDRN